MIMSDRGKEFGAPVDKIYPNAVYGYCCQYLAENIDTHGFSKECKRLFWCAAFAESEAAFGAVFYGPRKQMSPKGA